MTDQTRYRITGAVFLVAVAVITLPMLFDGDGIQAIDIQPLERPAVAALVNETPEPDFAPVREARERVNSIVDDDGFLADSGTLIGEPVLSAPGGEHRAADGSRWAVQVASFSQHENAVALRDALLAQEYPAWLSTVRNGNARTTRVGVGPMLSRSDADDIRALLAEDHADAMVVSFSP